MAITYLSGGRIQGSSRAEKDSTYNSVFDDATSSAWSTNTHSHLVVNTTDKRLEFDLTDDGTDEVIQHDMGASAGSISNTAWVLRCEITFTTWNGQENDNNNAIHFGCFADQTPDSITPDGDALMWGHYMRGNTSTDGFDTKLRTIDDGEDTTIESNNNPFSPTTAPNTPFYLELKRVSATSLEFRAYENSDYTGQIGSTIIRGTASTVTALRYITINLINQGTIDGGGFAGYIQNLKFWNDTTTANFDEKATLVTAGSPASDWTEVGNEWTLTGNQIDFALKRDGANSTATVDLGADASATWVLRMHVNFTGNSSGDNYAYQSFWGLSSQPNNYDYGDTQDSAGFLLHFAGTGGSGDNRFAVSEGDNADLEGSSSVTVSGHTVTPTGEWYIELKRTASATITLGLYTDATYAPSALVSGTSVTSNTAFSGADLRYLKLAVPNYSTQGEIQNGTVDTVEFYDNMTTASGTPTKFLSGDSSDLPVGTRYEETNTRKIFRMKDGAGWVEKGTA